MKHITLTFFIAVFLLLTGIKSAFTQEIDSIPQTYNNSIKGMLGFTVPIFFPFAATISVGYERKIGDNKFIELCGYYGFTYDEMGNTGNYYSLKPGYRYYIKKKKDKGPQFWLGTYFSYLLAIASWDINERCSYDQYFGIGASVGTRIFISKDKRGFLDLGFGGSFNKSISKDYYFNNHSDTFGILLRPIIQFGFKF